MDFIDQIKQLSKRVSNLKEKIQTEEATKTSLIMPFFQLLGYDVFNPSEFLPEYTADIGIKKGEKVDYAIMRENNPVILIEAKWCGENLENHNSQLFRYFSATTAKFAILTNGIEYRFFTDLDEKNKMDEKPFLIFNLEKIKENQVNELKKFHKDNFDIDTLFNCASELKYVNSIKSIMTQQLNKPTDEFITFILSDIYSGRKTQNVIDKFRETVKKSLNLFITERINERLQSALEKQTEKTEEDIQKSEIEELKEGPKIVTTEEELEAFYTVKTILRNNIDPERLFYKDTQSYFNILLDNKTTKWICRLYFDHDPKYIIIPDENKRGKKHQLDNIEDIIKFKDSLLEVINRYKND